MLFAGAKLRVDWTVAAAGVVAAYASFLVAMFIGHFWLRDGAGHVLANDFVAVFAAGKLALSGHASTAYDWTAHRTVEIAAAGRNFHGYYGWHYPPPFLFIAAALSKFPYFISFFLWIGLTLPLYAFVVSRIAARREAILWALAFPAVLLDIYVGQNGLFTAALFGAMLLTLKDRPVVSGILIGLLTYKPQFGILIPVALIAGGHWRALVTATVTACALCALSVVAFGWDTWLAFFSSVPHTTDVILAGGEAGWNKLQTVYGVARWSGMSDAAAWSLQIGSGLLMAAGVAWIWRSRAPFALKAAALCGATLLATPYAYIYDLPLLALAIAFLYRHRRFDVRETVTLLAAAFLIAIFPWVSLPVGLAATLFVASLVSRRGRKLAAPRRDVALQHA